MQGTLKITSAMKLVASAKLHKAQAAIEGALPYQQQLESIMQMVVAGEANHPLCAVRETKKAVALVCIASNTSLCGGYNASLVRSTTALLEKYVKENIRVRVYPIGRKMEQALTKWAGRHTDKITLVRDYVDKGDKPDYADAERLSQILSHDFLDGQTDEVQLVYMHFRSMASQTLMHEALLPMQWTSSPSEGMGEGANIFEPTREALLQSIVPDALAVKMYAVLLDAQAAEHAARTMAMQTATDNANELLEDLQIQYNKGRQAAITAELLDIVGGSMQ